MRFIFNKPPEPKSWVDYCVRFNNFKSEIDNRDFATAFLRFALFSGTSKQLVVLGTNNPQHLRESIKIETEMQNSDPEEIARYEELWLRKSEPDWTAHVG